MSGSSAQRPKKIRNKDENKSNIVPELAHRDDKQQTRRKERETVENALQEGSGTKKTKKKKSVSGDL
jgi:hypothetical protein